MRFFLIDRLTSWQVGVAAEALKNMALSEDFFDTIFRGGRSAERIVARGCAAGEEIVAGRGCLATPVPLADYADPADLRVLFSEIYRPDR